MRGSPTDKAPVSTSDTERAAYRDQVETKRLRGRGRWRGTGDFNVPGWVLGEMLAEGLIEHRKRSGSSPNEWR